MARKPQTVAIRFTRSELSLLIATFTNGYTPGYEGNEAEDAIGDKLRDARDRRDAQ